VFQPVHESFGVLIADLELDERPGLGLSCVNVTDTAREILIVVSATSSRTAPTRKLSAMRVPTMTMDTSISASNEGSTADLCPSGDLTRRVGQLRIVPNTGRHDAWAGQRCVGLARAIRLDVEEAPHHVGDVIGLSGVTAREPGRPCTSQPSGRSATDSRHGSHRGPHSDTV